MHDVLIKKVNTIESEEIEKMFLLHSSYFSNVRREKFIHDLNEKNWSILIKDGLGQIKGYSTIQLIDTEFEGKQIKFLFSGDTLVAQENWHNNLLAGAFGHFMIYLNKNYFESEIYWLLISKGFRTYRFLPVYYKEYFPVYNQKTPPRMKALMDHICFQKFGKAYDPQRGLIVSNGDSDYLQADVADIPKGREKNPHVNFFINQNPHYYRGDELVCLAKLHPDNFRLESANRVIRLVKVRWV